MRKLFIDFETRSERDLTKEGAHRYTSDKSTEMLMCTYAFDDEPIRLVTSLPDEVVNAIFNENVLKIAHNAEFDMCVVRNVIGLPLFGFNDWFDTAYQAAYYGLPRSLARLAAALKCKAKGSQEELMLFSKPLRPSKSKQQDEYFSEERAATYATKEQYPVQWQAFETYAKGDVEVMREAFNKMPMLPDLELFTMRITFEMNFHGVPFDADLARRIYERSQRYAADASKQALEKYGIENLRSTVQVRNALLQHGICMESLNAKTRAGVKHDILELRDQTAGAAFSKIPTAFTRLCTDGRLHGEFVGYGAHTGRWSSRGTQLQNWSRILDEVSETLENVKDYSHLRQHMRLCLGHVSGMLMTVADLSQIEARVTAWLAGCIWRMDAFANGSDIYALSACKLFGLDHVDKGSPERFMGKTYELALGFGGGGGAVERMNPEFYVERGAGKVSDDVQQWRAANPEIQKLWYNLQNAFIGAIDGGHVTFATGAPTHGMATFLLQYDGRTMKLTLPSGRALYYRGVHLETDSYGRREIYYHDYSRGGEHSVRVKVWGGTLLENVVQAIARDVLVEIMKRVRYKYPDLYLVGTVHDELWYMHKETRLNALEDLLAEMSAPIVWAKGLVTKGDGFTYDRYIK